MADHSLMEGPSDEEIELAPDMDEPYIDASGHDLDDRDDKIMDRQEKIPRMGMVFKSYEEVRGFYDHYARHTGFGTKTKRSWYNEDGQLLKSVLACRKEGRAPDAPTYRSRPTAKTNCQANIKVELMPDNLLHLVEINLEHNHAVSPSKARFFRSNKKLVNGLKRRLDTNFSGIQLNKPYQMQVAQVGQPEYLPFDEKQYINYSNNPSFLKLGKGDMQALQQYFFHMQIKNANFFYLLDLDEEGHWRNVFWSDTNFRIAYQYFGDVILFDTTYLRNKYDVPFVSFIGVNHHGQSVLLGGGLLSSETIETYIWLFKVWLACVYGRPPNAIITDQCKAIQAAVSEVFPTARYRICLWNLMKRFPDKLGGLPEYKAFKRRFKKLIYDSLRVDEFEEDWRNMILEYGLQTDEWLMSLYEDRLCWAPVFVKETFWAGMSSTQRNEHVGAFFDGYVHPKTSLQQFLSKYELVLRSKSEKEAQADFDSFDRSPPLISKLYIEEQLSKLYTIDMFKKFQDELKALIYCRASLVTVNGPISTFEVKERVYMKDGKKMDLKVYEVLYNAEKEEVRCICHSFECRGILCRHAVSVLNFQDVDEIPSLYVLDRWRKDYKQLHAMTCYTKSREVNSPTERYDNLYMHCIELAEIGAGSKDKYKLAMNLVRELKGKLLVDDYTREEGRPTAVPSQINARECNGNPSLGHPSAIGNTINGDKNVGSGIMRFL
ncbi:protein FAR1-RELATED SEQUENCE 6-like [Aristolochia californica]|uniref:protein FAR1-RELATED SEQUENCE 6-like n=1 Tax=Aristolochia californica TaxID=171875 RepID=UPI0035DF5FF7